MAGLSPLRRVTRKKGRPPPGGEEAEVVVYQPRGVGLMHTRHKPSNAHYTHGSAEGRKCCLLKKAGDCTKDAVTGTCLELPICTHYRLAPAVAAYADAVTA